MKRALLTSAASIVVAAMPVSAKACAIVAMGHNAVVTGLPAATPGMLCVGDEGGSHCRALSGDAHGSLAAYEPETIVEPVWFVPAKGETCSAAPSLAPDRGSTFWMPLLAILLGAGSALGGVFLQMRGSQRESSRAAAAQWKAEFASRIQAFIDNPEIDPQPKPLPALGKAEGQRISGIAELARRALDRVGHAPVSSTAVRRQAAATILAALAGKSPGGTGAWPTSGMQPA